MSSTELTAFLAWAEENEILWDKTAIEIKETSNKHGLGVFAKKHLEPGYEGNDPIALGECEKTATEFTER